MSKRDEAFELFGQGKLLTDPEVKALGLKTDSAKKYYRLWKQSAGIEPVATAEPKLAVEVPFSEIPIGAEFEYLGKEYTKIRARMLMPDAMVIPK